MNPQQIYELMLIIKKNDMFFLIASQKSFFFSLSGLCSSCALRHCEARSSPDGQKKSEKHFALPTFC